MSEIVDIADQLIPPANGKIVFKKNGETPDIIAEVLSAFRDSRGQLNQFAPHLKADSLQQTLYNVWAFWKHNVTYQIDPDNKQFVQEPAAFWAPPRQGDCKSFSVAVMSTLFSLGIKAAFRFASYGTNEKFPTHVYVVVLSDGKEIPVDCVWKEFGTQKPYTKKWDYNMSTAIYRVSGLPEDNPAVGRFRFGKMFKRLANPFNSLKLLHKLQPQSLLKAAKNKKKKRRGIRGVLDMPLDNPNITGEVADLLLDKQYLEMQQIQHAKVHGIGTTYDHAFETQILAHHNALAGVMGWPEKSFTEVGLTPHPAMRGDEEDSGIYGKKNKGPKVSKSEKKLRKAKDANAAGKAVSKKQAKLLAKAGITASKIKQGLLKRIGKGVLKVLKTPARLALATQLPKNGPFFLYLFITDPKVLAKLPDQVNVKRQKALKYKGIIVDKLQMKESNFEKAVRNGIMNQFGKSPEDVLAEWMKTANFNIGFIDTALKLAGKGLKLLLGKAAANLQEDVANYTPAPEDWGILTEEQKSQMASAVQSQPGNQPQTMDQLNAGNGGGNTYANRGSNSDDATGDTDLNDEQTNDEAVVTASKKAKKTPEPETEPEQKDNTMLYLGVAAVAVFALSSGKAHK